MIDMNRIQVSSVFFPNMHPVHTVIGTLLLQIKLAFWLARCRSMHPAAIERPIIYTTCV